MVENTVVIHNYGEQEYTMYRFYVLHKSHVQTTEQCYQSILRGRHTHTAELLEITKETLRAFLRPVKVGIFSEPWGHKGRYTFTVAIQPVFDIYKQKHCTSLGEILQ